MPNTNFQHITFTMPDTLWNFFWCNRHLLQPLGKIAANCIKKLATAKKVTPGIFIAIHTFGRDLKRNVHVHLSTTTGGLSANNSKWKSLYFKQSVLMSMWRFEIIKLLRQQQDTLVIPPDIKSLLNNSFTLNDFLNSLYQKTWIIHCAKPTNNHKKTVEYLGRYLKRPAIAESKLRHYDGNSVSFRYLDHSTKTYRNFTLSVEQFIGRFIQHIPDLGFRMIRYYGFLANRVRGKLLPIVYQLLEQNNTTTTTKPTFASLTQKYFNFNPLTCILCGQQLILSAVRFGKTTIAHLLAEHSSLAQFKTFSA
jgi:hypothetical protein